ncbi:MAG TPA: hypothetical protein DIT40_05990 [Alphaproteobacteria bacterium]|nr:hypothetical protein [Alphaproteobacteria bacterium]
MWSERTGGGGGDLIDLADAKAYLRILEDDFDAEIGIAIRAASAYLDLDDEGFGGLSSPVAPQTWRVYGSGFNPTVLRLPFARIRSVTSVQYTAPDGTTGTVPGGDYDLIRIGRAYHIRIEPGAAWPATRSEPGSVRIDLEAGFEDVDSIPEDIKAAARLLIGHFFENRDGGSAGKVSDDVMSAVDSLTRRYRPFAM